MMDHYALAGTDYLEKFKSFDFCKSFKIGESQIV